MSICPSGVSAQIPGTADVVILTGAVLSALASRYGLGWLTTEIIGAATSELQLQLPTFCAADPPADPGLTGADLVTLVTDIPIPASTAPGLKVVQLLQRFAWYSFCRCATATTPAPPTAPAAPSGAPAINPPAQAPGPANTACAVTTETGAVYAANQSNFLNYAGTNLAILGATSAQLDLTCTPFVAPGGNVRFDFYQNDHSGTQLRLDTFVESATSHDVFSIPIAAGCESTQLKASVGAISGSVTVKRTVSYFCNNAVPGGTQSPCCPPDPLIGSRLDALLAMVTLIQRQAVPFAYVVSTAHAGLSGNGAIAVTGILGIRIDVTTAPGRLGQVDGHPIDIYDAGWVNIGTADGYGPREFISSNPTLLLPISSAATSIGYSIPADVTVTITELVREP